MCVRIIHIHVMFNNKLFMLINTDFSVEYQQHQMSVFRGIALRVGYHLSFTLHSQCFYVIELCIDENTGVNILFMHFCSFSPPKPFHPMVNLVCSADLRMFLCALYAPVCTVYGHVSMPCRSLCQRAKDECHKLMEIFGVAWPDDMECSRYESAIF